MEAIFGVIGAVGVGWGIFRDIAARRDRRRREEVEAQLREEREKREALLGRAGRGSADVGLHKRSRRRARRARQRRCREQGQHIARDVTFGLRYGDEELVAGTRGNQGSVRVLAAGESVPRVARIEQPILGRPAGAAEADLRL